MKQIFFILTFIFINFSESFASPGVKADSLYNKEDYQNAITLYEKSLNEEGPDAETYYNLGNAFYRSGKIGKAVLSYERALKLDPTHQDSRINLEFVRSKIEDLPEDDSAFLSQLHSGIVHSLHPNSWAVVSAILFGIFLICVALYIFSPNVLVRKWGFFGGLVILIFFIYALFTTLTSVSEAKSHDEAIVIVPTTYLSSTPRAQTGTDKTVAIHEGTKVEIVDSISTPDDPTSSKWYNVKINNSSKAWLKSADVERI